MTNLLNKKIQDLNDFVNKFGLSSDATGYEDDEALEDYTLSDYLRASAEYNAPDIIYNEDINTALYLFSEYAEWHNDPETRAKQAITDYLEIQYNENLHNNALQILDNILTNFIDADDDDHIFEIIRPTFSDILTEYENDAITYKELYNRVKRRRISQQSFEEFQEIGGYLI